MPLEFRGVHADILADTTPERDVEGSLNCGKTTVCLWAELNALEKYPGIWILLTRLSDDSVSTKLRPAFDQLCTLHTIGMPKWDDKKKFYEFANGSRAYAFGLKSVSLVERYEKIRGLPVSRIFVDQAEAIAADMANELRARLRPDVLARERGIVYPTQLTFSANPVPDGHFLDKQFPVDNSLKRRKYFCVALTDNSHNLPADTVEGMLQAYPDTHPKHLTVILGKRGLNVTGEPIYESVFTRGTHVRPLALIADSPLLEAYEVGKHNPAWVCGQVTHHGAVRFLGGIIGQGLVLEDFLPLVRRYRTEWFPPTPNQPPLVVKSCTGPMGDKHTASSERFTLVRFLQESGIRLQWRDNANAPDVRLAMVEELASRLRKRVGTEEAIGINSDPSHWLKASRESTLPAPFLEHGFSGGYTWDEHFTSISHKDVRQPHEDDWFANGQHCAEHLLLTFIAGVQSGYDRELKAQQMRTRMENQPAFPSGPGSWMAQ